MDPFGKLPIEILSLILTHVEREDLPQVTRASPACFYAEQVSHNYITRHHTLRDLFGGGNILQDALALLTYPTFTVEDIHAHMEHEPPFLEQDLQIPLPENVPANGRTTATDRHLKTWAAGGFPDPFLSQDMKTIGELDRLCHHIWLLASDYLYKATQEHLPTAYDQLPLWACSSSEKDQSSNLLGSYSKPSLLGQLTPIQRSRLLQAFIRYELLCKVYRPIAGTKYTHTASFSSCGCRHTPKAWKMPQNGPFRRWRWDLLHVYKGSCIDLPELEILALVREYVMCTFARLSTDSISRSSLEENNEQEVLYQLPPGTSDPRRFEAYKIRADLNAELHGEQLDSALATCGLGTLAQCLQLSPEDRIPFFNSLSHELCREKQRAEPTATGGMIVSSDTAGWHAGIITRLHRQRAMEVFRKDNGSRGRLYMSPDDVMKVYQRQLQAWEGGLAEGMDEPFKFPCDAAEGIVHGCHRAYESLTGMMTDLWEQSVPSETEL